MLETQAVVLKVEKDFAFVKTQRQSGCGHCDAQKKECATTALGNVFGAKHTLFKALNPMGAQVGDRVLIGVAEGALLRGSLAVYLVPLLLLIGGAAGGTALAPSAATDGYSVAGALLGLVAAYLWLRGLGTVMGSSRRFQPVVVGKVGEEKGVSIVKGGLE